MSLAERFPFWSKLSYHEKNYIDRMVFLKHYSKGDIIFNAIDSFIGITHVISGRARMYICTEDGKELTLFRIKQGDSLVLSAADIMERITYETELIAEEETDVIMLGKAEFDTLANNSLEIRAFMYQSIAEHLSDVMCGLKRMILDRLDVRLANYILEESKCGQEPILRTQEQVAIELGTAREVVTRTLGHFEAMGYITLKRGRIIVQDAKGLKQKFNL